MHCSPWLQPRFPLLFALTQYHQGNASDTRVIPAMFKYLHEARRRMFKTSFGYTWAGARWQDFVMTLHWLLENESNGEEQFLWDLAEMAAEQGFNWQAWFSPGTFPQGPVPADKTTLYTHGVNNGQAIKSCAVRYRMDRNMSQVESCSERMMLLDKYHGMPTGMFGCDEHLAGRMPSRGTELCTVVESMFR